MEHPGRDEPTESEGQITLDPEIAKHVIPHKSYIFDDLSLHINNQIGVLNKYAIPAAFMVHNPHKRWIFVFTLKSGWI